MKFVRQSAPMLRWRWTGSSALIALLGAVLAVLGLSVSTSPARPASSGSAPEVWIDGQNLSWSPVGDAQSYILATWVAGKTVRQEVVGCCSVILRGFADAGPWYFLRVNVSGSAWSRPHRWPTRPPASPTASVPPTPPPTTVTPTPSPTTPSATAPPPAPPPPASEQPPPPPANGSAPGRVCDNQPDSYPSPVTGAVVVDPAIDGDLSAKTEANPPGTTFWLSPGTHTLGTSEFGQVIPKDGNTYLGAPGAILDGRGKNQYAFTQHAVNVTIRNLTIQGFVAPRDQGVVNHDSGDGWVIEDSTIQRNGGAGLMAGARQQVRRNCLRDNGQYGMNAYQDGDSIVGLVVEYNEIVGNNTDDWESKVEGCGCTGGIKFWAVNGADIRSNWVHDNHGAALWADTNNNDFLIENNLIEGNEAEGLMYETSYNAIVRGNTFRKNAWAAGKAFADRGDNFPVAAVYLSEAGGDPRVPARTDKIDIYDNLFDNNWSGITAWENADRFCNSPANTSGGYCTKRVSATAQCAQPGIATAPLYDDCRWKTQRVDVHGNRFLFDPTSMGCTNGFCGRMAVLSNYGTFPSWSPYQGNVIQEAITFQQDNRWRSNAYVGPWTFMAYDTSRTLNAAQWQATPYGQDACSTFSGGSPPC